MAKLIGRKRLEASDDGLSPSWLRPQAGQHTAVKVRRSPPPTGTLQNSAQGHDA